MTVTVRPPAVAGSFYPASRATLDAQLTQLLGAVRVPAGPCPKALIVPHAGYIYSGPIAASAFARVAPYGDRIERVVLLGPAHRVVVNGRASPGADRLATPLGEIEVEQISGVHANPAAHAREHSLEVELPFLQKVCPNARVVALCGSRARPEEVGTLLEQNWGGPETLIVISSDLSHYLPYAQGRALDEQTAQQILGCEPVEGEHACGSIGINGLLWVAHRRGMKIELVDLRSSGDTAGDKA